MGFLDNLLNTLESGDLERRLDRLSDTVEQVSRQADNKLQAATERPAQLLDTAERASDRVGQAAGQPVVPEKGLA